MRTVLIYLWLCVLPLCLVADDGERAYALKKTSSPIVIDGVLDDAGWQMAEIATDFTQTYPNDTGLAIHQTFVRATYDDRFLYVSASCHFNNGGKIIVESLRRDFLASQNDLFAVFINPQNDLRTGFAFLVNAYGAQAEGAIATGGSFGYALSWDNKWYSEVNRTDSVWTVEMAIPFKTLRYDSDLSQWSINFARSSLDINENSCWQPIPRGFNLSTLAFTGKLNWDNPPEKSGSNVAIIPYAITGLKTDYNYGETEDNREHLTNLGVDAKIAVSSSLNLDVTVNPDFSQVEVDQQVINLDRFSIFLPERRNFFLENEDLFQRFGFSKIRPFFSRRIGIMNGRQTSILGGLRLSGNVNEDWRIGFMTIQTEGQPATETEDGFQGNNYIVGAFQRKVFGYSNIAGIIVNRQAFDGYGLDKGNFNTLIGLDYNIADNKDRFRGKLFYHQSFSDDNNRDAGANASWLRYKTSNIYLEWNHEYVGDNYQADVGFVPRIGYFRLEPIARYFWYPKVQKKINLIEFGIYQSYYWNSDWQLTDRVVKPSVQINFLDYSSFGVSYRDLQTRLVEGENFDPTGKGETPLPAGNYLYRTGSVFYNSDFRKPFSFSAFFQGGSFYVGHILSYSAGMSYRFRPWGSVSVDFERNEIRNPDPFTDANLTLIGGKIDVSFTRNLFFNTFIQYNTAANNININSRFQWRFKPMSDLFFVYTENYTDQFGIKNRAFVVKLSYWFTI